MSYQLPTIDMSQFAVGKSGQISFDNVKGKVAFDPSNESNPPHVRIFNDSGSALSITSDDGSISDYIPAGAWPVYELGQTTRYMNFTVLAILPNPPIQLLMPTFYIPGEAVPETPQLGNSPIGIGGTIQTSSVQTLSNEGSAPVALVIDIGDNALSQLIIIHNDGTTIWKVDANGVPHQVFKINSSGAPYVPLQLGASGDITEVMGNAQIDGTETVTGSSTFTGNATFNGAGTGVAVTNNETVGGTLGVTGISTLTGNLVANGGMNINTIRDNVNGNTAIDLADGTGVAEFPVGVTTSAVNEPTGDTSYLSLSGTGATMNTRLQSGNAISLQVPQGTTIATIDATGIHLNGAVKFDCGTAGFVAYKNGGTVQGWSSFTGSGSGTYNHNFGSAPFHVIPIVDVAGSATQGYDTVTATQVHITLGAVLAFKAMCWA